MRRIFIYCSLLIALFGLGSNSLAQTAPSLFERVPLIDVPNRLQAHPQALQSSFVRLSTVDVRHQARIAFNAFPNLTLQLDLSRIEPNQAIADGYTWIGQIEGVPNGLAVLSYGGGEMSAHLLYRTQKIIVRSVGEGFHAVELHHENFGEVTSDDTLLLDNQAPQTPLDWTPSPVTEAGDLINIDVLVIYSANARAKLGGTTAILNNINTAFANGNAAHVNTDTNVRYQLVHAAEVNFNETTSGGNQLLNYMADPDDAKLDELWALRNQHGADLVAFVGDPNDGAGSLNPLLCGIGNLMGALNPDGRNSQAFTVTDTDCLLSFTLAHELGHNLGLHHDPANGGPAQFPGIDYNFGYKDPGFARTVMSYACDDNPETPESELCERVAMWSNVGVNWNGRPMGTATQDNRRAMNITAAVLQYYRTCPDIAVYSVPAGDVAALKTAIAIAAGDYCHSQPITITLGGGTYNFTTNDNLSFGANALPVLNSDLVIEGNNATLNLNNARRLIYAYDASLTLRNMSITNGFLASNDGGAIYLSSVGSLSLQNVNFTNNQANYGGAVFTHNTQVDFDNVNFTDNSAIEDGGALYLADSSGNAVLDNISFSGNSATYGGALISGSPLTINYSTFDNNQAANSGGAIYLYGTSVQTSINDSIFTNNQAPGNGGGAINVSAPLTIERSLFQNNSTANYWGGAIIMFGGTLDVNNSTFSSNSALNGGGAIYSNLAFSAAFNTFYRNNAAFGDSFQLGNSVNATLFANLFDDGTSSNCSIGTGSALISNGYNISDDNTCPLSNTGDAINTNPLLGALANHNSTMPTHLPQAGSPAIERVPAAACNVAKDARGVNRPQNTNCESGSHEVVVNTPDVNGDGNISASDAIFVINRLGTSPTGDNAVADVDNDGDIDNADVQEVLSNLGN